MWALFYVIFVFMVVLILSRKLELGYSLLTGSVLIVLFSRMGLIDCLRSIQNVFIERKTAGFFSVIFLVLILSQALKSSGQLERLVETAKDIFHDLRVTVFFLPALIGMLPMPGGAYFSAPMVGAVLKDTNLSPEKKVFANYWFRHIWEYILPVYPGIVALISLTELEFREVVKVNILLSISAVLGGVFIVFGKGGLTPQKKPYRGNLKSFLKFLRELSPVAIILIMVIFLRVPVALALAIGIGSVLLMNRFGLRAIIDTFRKAMSWKMFVMVLGIVIFKAILTDSGAVGEIASFMEKNSVGAIPVIFGISFLSGFVTGITIAFVGISLPIVLTILQEPTPWNMMFVFACGFGGVLLSPVHLCLVLTSDYFRADMSKVYRYIIPATLLVMAVGFLGIQMNP